MVDPARADLLEAVARVLRDLDATLGPGRVLIDVPPRHEGADAWIHVAGVHPRFVGVVLHPGELLDDLAVRVADTAQDCIAESDPTWGRAWPRCPVHPDRHHPLTPRRVEGRAVWCCPVTDAEVAPIGALAPPSAPRSARPDA